jgi:hypothetical protein
VGHLPDLSFFAQREINISILALFMDVPHPSISFIYASLGCQHILAPCTNDFAPPSIPVLTENGFVRWPSIGILLGPEEHVPLIQYAARNFSIKNPYDGEPFPIDLPKEVFPIKCDSEIEKRYTDYIKKLRQTVTLIEGDSRASLPPRPKGPTGYIQVRAANDYFKPKPSPYSQSITVRHRQVS